MTDNKVTPEMIQAILEDNDVSKADEKELYKALNALNKTIVVASNGTIVPALDSGGKLSIGEIGLVGEKGPELVQGPADVTSRAETGEKIAAMVSASQVDLADVSTPIVDIAPKEVPKPEETPQGSPQLASDLDKQDAKADENLKLLANLGIILGRLDSRMEEQNSLTEKIVQYSSV